MPVLLAFITEDLDFSPSCLVLEDGCVFFRWFRCLTWGVLMEVDRSLLLDQRVKEVSEVSYLFFLLCLFLPLMQRTWECVLIIWAGCRTGTGEVICYLEFAISLYIAFHHVNRQLFPGPLEKCRLKKKGFWNVWLLEGKRGFNSVQSLSHVRLSATPWIAARQASLTQWGTPQTHCWDYSKSWKKVGIIISWAVKKVQWNQYQECSVLILVHLREKQKT